MEEMTLLLLNTNTGVTFSSFIANKTMNKPIIISSIIFKHTNYFSHIITSTFKCDICTTIKTTKSTNSTLLLNDHLLQLEFM